MSDTIFNVDGFRMVVRYETARKARAMWDDEVAAAREELLTFLGDGIEHGIYEGQNVVTVSRTRPKRFDQSAFAADHPAIYEHYRKEAEVDEIRLILPRHLPKLPHWYDDRAAT